MTLLTEMVTHKVEEIAKRQSLVSLEDIQTRALAASPPRKAAFGNPPVLIAEMKRRSPSAGELAPDLDPVVQAHAYQSGGASAISILCDDRFFGGSLDDLTTIRGAVDLPVLCKDFILTAYQVYEARAHGADLILLIVALLTDQTLIELQRLAAELGMTPLVEVHDQHDLARAIAADSHLIGINNRDLNDSSVDLLTTEYLAPLAPDDAVVVSESGMATPEDVRRALSAGASVVLVGETLMRAADPAATIRELLT